MILNALIFVYIQNMTAELTILNGMVNWLAQTRQRASFEEAQVAVSEEARLRRRIEKLEAAELANQPSGEAVAAEADSMSA